MRLTTDGLRFRAFQAATGAVATGRWIVGRSGTPDLLVIGAQKAGTTTLHDLLLAHPECRPPIRKEVDLLYRPSGRMAYTGFFGPDDDGRFTLDASPYLIFHPMGPARAAELVPDATVVAVLRDPVERAVSHYWHAVRMGYEERAPARAFAPELDHLAHQDPPVPVLGLPGSFKHRHRSYLSRSVYAPQLQRWTDRWATPLVVLGFREVLADPTRALDRVLGPIGRRSVPGLQAPRSNAGTAREEIDPGVLADVRTVLDRFTPAIEALVPGISDRW